MKTERIIELESKSRQTLEGEDLKLVVSERRSLIREKGPQGIDAVLSAVPSKAWSKIPTDECCEPFRRQGPHHHPRGKVTARRS